MKNHSNPDSTNLDSLQQQLSELTERELQLRTTSENLKQLFELAPFGYQSLDENGYFLDVNQTWLNTLGRAREEVIGRNFTEFLDPDMAAPFLLIIFSNLKNSGPLNPLSSKCSEKTVQRLPFLLTVG